MKEKSLQLQKYVENNPNMIALAWGPQDIHVEAAFKIPSEMIILFILTEEGRFGQVLV